MTHAVYLFALSACLFCAAGQSVAQQGVRRQFQTVTACKFENIGEYRETPQAGLANIICLSTGFNMQNKQCWQELAEYYYNVAPEPGVRIQRIYFVEVPKGTKPIRILGQLKSSPYKRQTFFECIYNVSTEKYSFANYPFTNK